MAIDLEQLNIVITGESDKASSAIDNLIDRLSALKTSVGSFSSSTQQAKETAKGLQSSLNGTTQEAKRLVNSIGEAGASSRSASTALRQTAESARSMAHSFGSANGKVGQLWKTVKRVATMRLIRWAIRQVVNAAKEGLEILIEWDRTFGNNTSYAAKTVDELSAKWREVKKAVGAAIMPLIQILQPALNFVMNAVIGIANAFNQLLRAIQGYDTYMKSTYINTKKTTESAKELKRVLFGFDELNVLNGNGGTGAAGSISPIEFKVKDVSANLKEVIDNIKNGVLWEAGDNYLDFNNYLNPQNMEEADNKVKDWLKNLFKIDDTWLSNLDQKIMGWFDGLWQSLKAFVSEGTENFKAKIGNVVDGVKKAVEEISIWWGKCKTRFTETWNNIKSWFSENVGTPVKNKLKEISDAIQMFFIDPVGAIKLAWMALKTWFSEKVINPIKTAWEGLTKLFGEGGVSFTAIKDGIKDSFVKAINALINGLNAVIKKPLEKLNEIITSIRNTEILGWKPFSNLKTITIPQIQPIKLAKGGDMDLMGTFYQVGERGAEVVATSPRGTGVMNMKQMQEAVSNGNVQVVNALGAMTNAVVSAINSKDTNAYLDGTKITETVLRRANGMARATGQPVIVR